MCGLWPFVVGAGAPMVGVPIGRHLGTGATVCCDPVSWFNRARLISNPSIFVMGLPGRGKSSLVKRMVTGLAGYGVNPIVAGDLKPDYVNVVRALGGQVIRLGRGRGHLNVMDPGEAREAAKQLRDAGHTKAAQELEAESHGRRLTMVSALIELVRHAPITDREETILDQALRFIDAHNPDVPVLADVLAVIRSAPESVRAVALDRGDTARYQTITEHLEASLIALTGKGRLGEMFAHPTDEPMHLDRPVAFDISGIDESDRELSAAALMACWSTAFASVAVAGALADAGIGQRRHYFVVMDEMWRALRASSGMVDRVDALTRLNRTIGVGLAMITHTMNDLEALPNSEDRAKARGFVERAGLVACAGLPQSEIPLLRSIMSLSAAEADTLTSWGAPPAWNQAGANTTPPGVGQFLIKVQGRPGIPVHVDLTVDEPRRV
ncbi:ATP/GTP-binding protein [Demequina litorisediminis]|uniref:ATPase n=1 Tax=Demequina litorisediminis TaxID=1849022 RepID=A0ABQ6IMA2_9MICO|nr:ATPase [Demequina litorisediminis]